MGSSSGLTLNTVGSHNFYQFINKTGSWAEVANESVSIGGTYKLSDYNGTSFQKWKITRVSDRDYTISNLGNGLYAQSYNHNGTRVIVQNNRTSGDEQLWRISHISGKNYKVVNAADGLAITGNGTGMVQLKPYIAAASQMWGFNQLPPSDTIKAGSFKLANILQNNMVIQRDKPFKVWGTASPNALVSVKASWNGSVLSTRSDGGGKWQVAIPAVAANTTPQTLVASVTGQPAVTLSNILIGDVWVCSGQSNMVMRMDREGTGFWSYKGVENYEAELAAAQYPQMRFLTVADAQNPEAPNADIPASGEWKVVNPANTKRLSAVAYYFGRRVHTAIKVPIGLVVAAFGGTDCEEWTSKEIINNDPMLKNYYASNPRIARFYNAMLYPLKDMAIKGFVWYQGENNVGNEPKSNYTALNIAMVKNWRSIFADNTLPFYYTQLSAYNQGGNDYVPIARFREAQVSIMDFDPGRMGMAVTVDAGQWLDIHSTIKKPVGDRLAFNALHKTYGLTQVKYRGPNSPTLAQTDNAVTLTFKDAKGLKAKKGGTKNTGDFYVAEANKIFVKATANIIDGKVVITKPKPNRDIVSVRYTWYDFPTDNTFQNSDGLPMEPFRLDAW
ncbi:sialate O-acetylesterase [Mucilaginibacter hurinus]|nr:sialate O-acetylesterase [Mucilaginibacter hurinus]